MKIVVTEMPKEPKDCLFSLPVRIKGEVIFVCNLRPLIPDEKTERDFHKPKCICKSCDKCNNLEVLK